MIPRMVPGRSLSNSRIHTKLVKRPTTKETPTSRGVCTPRYIREKPVSRIMMAQSHVTHLRFAQRAIAENSAVTFWVWPLGKE